MENLEEQEIDLLIAQGYSFETQLFGKKKQWKVKKIPIGKMLKLSKIFIRIKVDDDISSENVQLQIPAMYDSVRHNAKLCAQVIATAVDSKYPKWFLKWHFMNCLNSKEVKDIAYQLLTFSDYKNFTLSMALMNGNRPTKAKPIEETV